MCLTCKVLVTRYWGRTQNLPGLDGKDVIVMQDIEQMCDITELWTHAKTAWFLKVTPKTLYVWNSLGTGPKSYKINGSRRYDPRDVQQFLRDRYAAGTRSEAGHAAA